MTNLELNRDIKRLHLKIESLKNVDVKKLSHFIENDGKKEFLRLYHADRTCEDLTLKSLKIMMTLNRQFRYITVHSFYIDIEV